MSEYPTLLSPTDLGPLRLPNQMMMGSMYTGLEESGDWDPGAAGLFTDEDIANHAHVTGAVH